MGRLWGADGVDQPLQGNRRRRRFSRWHDTKVEYIAWLSGTAVMTIVAGVLGLSWVCGGERFVQADVTATVNCCLDGQLSDDR